MGKDCQPGADKQLRESLIDYEAALAAYRPHALYEEAIKRVGPHESS